MTSPGAPVALAALRVLICCALVSCRRDAPRAPLRPSAVLWFGGDVHVGANVSALFERSSLTAELAGAYGFVNLEGAVVEGAGASSAERLVNDRRALASLRASGVRVASIANNHADDDGPGSRSRSAARVRSAAIEPVGERDEPVVTEPAPGLRVAWVALDLRRGESRSFRALFARMRSLAPVRVLSLHVTAPPLYSPPPAELRAAVREAVDERVTIVVAHGTHTVAPITRDRETLVAWGLGNLLFSCACSRETEGLVLRATVDARGVVAADVAPLEAGLDGRAARFGGEEGASFALLRALDVQTRADAGALAAPLSLFSR